MACVDIECQGCGKLIHQGDSYVRVDLSKYIRGEILAKGKTINQFPLCQTCFGRIGWMEVKSFLVPKQKEVVSASSR